MSMRRRQVIQEEFIFATLDELVPDDHMVRKLEEALNWEFIYPLVEPLYAEKGRPSIDPVVLFKMIFINYLFGINSMRKTAEEIKVNLAYRWFLHLSLRENVPNYSTWSQNYIRRYGDSDIFDRIFKEILRQAIENRFLDPSSVYGDATHQKASANKRKAVDKEVEIVKKVYEDDLLKEINEEREKLGKKAFSSLKHSELLYDEESGEVTEVREKKHIKESVTDPEAGLFHKGEKEKCFAYCHQTFCDKNGFVLSATTVPGNIHDSQSFFPAYRKLISEFPKIKKVILDAGYALPFISREVSLSEKELYLPYKRPNGMKKEGIKKKDFLYEPEKDSYLCPQGKELTYANIGRDAYKVYRCNDCKDCPLHSSCTKEKKKTLHRHLWADYLDEDEKRRKEKDYKDIYGKRKETIERVFADCKESHGLRYTRLRGLKKNAHQATLLFACHNLKRIADWKWKRSHREG